MTSVGSGSVRSDTQPLQLVHEAEPLLSVAGWSLAGKPRDHEEALPSGDNGGCLGSNPKPGEQAPVMLGIVGSFSSKPPVTVGSVSVGSVSAASVGSVLVGGGDFPGIIPKPEDVGSSVGLYFGCEGTRPESEVAKGLLGQKGCGAPIALGPRGSGPEGQGEGHGRKAGCLANVDTILNTETNILDLENCENKPPCVYYSPQFCFPYFQIPGFWEARKKINRRGRSRNKRKIRREMKKKEVGGVDRIECHMVWNALWVGYWQRWL